MDSKVKIELSPYDALEILTFMKHWPGIDRPDCAALKRAVENLEQEVLQNITLDQVDEAIGERKVHQLLGTSPQS